MLCWPAFFNGYPLLYPDSTGYLTSGPSVMRALLLGEYGGGYGNRSLLYGLTILPLHVAGTPWPIVGFHAVLTVYVLRLTLQRVARVADVAVLAVALVLAVATGVGWFVGAVMPDILAPLTILCVFLLGIEWHALETGQRWLVAGIALLAVAAHLSHLLLACGLTLGVASLALLARRRVWGAVGRLAMILALATAGQIALNAHLLGQPSLTGQRPPFLLARVIADGPGRWYLQRHCDRLSWAICAYADRLPDDVRGVLWAPDGIWRPASPALRRRLLQEEWPVVWGAVGAYPAEQLRASLRNAWAQLGKFGVWLYDPNPYIGATIGTALPGAERRYASTRQARRQLHEGLFTGIQDVTVKGSLLAIALLAFLLRRRWTHPLGALAVLVLSGVVGNAVIAGALANVEDRYQARVIWLLPFLACALVLALGPPAPRSAPGPDAGAGAGGVRERWRPRTARTGRASPLRCAPARALQQPGGLRLHAARDHPHAAGQQAPQRGFQVDEALPCGEHAFSRWS